MQNIDKRGEMAQNGGMDGRRRKVGWCDIIAAGLARLSVATVSALEVCQHPGIWAQVNNLPCGSLTKVYPFLVCIFSFNFLWLLSTFWLRRYSRVLFLQSSLITVFYSCSSPRLSSVSVALWTLIWLWKQLLWAYFITLGTRCKRRGSPRCWIKSGWRGMGKDGCLFPIVYYSGRCHDISHFCEAQSCVVISSRSVSSTLFRPSIPAVNRQESPKPPRHWWFTHLVASVIYLHFCCCFLSFFETYASTYLIHTTSIPPKRIHPPRLTPSFKLILQTIHITTTITSAFGFQQSHISSFIVVTDSRWIVIFFSTFIFFFFHESACFNAFSFHIFTV